MHDTSDEGKSCFKFYSWMKPRELHSTIRHYFEAKESRSRSSSSSSVMTSRNDSAKFLERAIRNYTEKASISAKERLPISSETDKENRVRKDSLGSNSTVKSLKMRFEEISASQRNALTVTGNENARATGAIKKRIERGEEKNLGAKKRVGFGEEAKFGTKRRVEFGGESSGVRRRFEFGDDKSGDARKRVKVSIDENDAFVKSRFKVYADEQPYRSQISETKKHEGKLQENVPTMEQVIQNRRLQRLIPESGDRVHERFTPIDALGVPLAPKKVKVQHRKSLMTGSAQPNNHTGSLSQRPAPTPYEDDFVKIELDKEKPLSRMARGYRKKNITVEQRKIIIKFLTRLHTHSFYPSFFLHQTVRIFDAVLDAKLIPLEDMQLVALAAMWIALKREQITYNLPTAARMISYSKDLYEGRVDLLLKCEREILQTLNFEIVFPEPFSILYYYITSCKRSQFLQDEQLELAYYCGGYMLDLSLFEEELMKKSAVLVAAAAAEASMFFVMLEEKCESDPWWFTWRSPDASSRYSETEIGEVRSILIQRISESHHRHSDGEIIFKKYSRSRYRRISHYLCNKVKLFLGTE